MRNEIDLSLIAPCYNEAEHLTGSIAELLETLRMCNFRWEVIFIEDCSKDNTRELLKPFESIPGVKVIGHEKNSGRGAAVKTGIRAARGKYCGYLDIDLEVHCVYVPQMLQTLRNGADMVIGLRTYRPSSVGLVRHFLSRAYNQFIRVFLGLPPYDTESGYKFFVTEKVKDLIQRTPDNHWFWDTEIVVQAMKEAWNIKQFPVLFVRKFEKTSTVRVIPDTLDYLKKAWRFRKSLKS